MPKRKGKTAPVDKTIPGKKEVGETTSREGSRPAENGEWPQAFVNSIGLTWVAISVANNVNKDSKSQNNIPKENQGECHPRKSDLCLDIKDLRSQPEHPTLNSISHIRKCLQR